MKFYHDLDNHYYEIFNMYILITLLFHNINVNVTYYIYYKRKRK